MRVSVAFYRGSDNSAEEPWLNVMAKIFTGEFVHCELVFDDPCTGAHTLACSVWQNETVFLRPKKFGRTNWIHVELILPDISVRTMKAWCTEQIGKPFNTSGFYRCITPFPRYSNGDSWFCSELVVTALKEAGYLETAIPSTCTPTYLYKMLLSDSFDSYVGSHPLVDNRISCGGGLSSRAALRSNMSLIRQWSTHVVQEEV